MEPIARISTNIEGKFGIPRQSGVVQGLKGVIQFEKPYRNQDALRGLEDFSHIWLIWQFSESVLKPGEFRPLVRPPRLGGNHSMGVFATRSPFRPNSLGMTVVKIEGIDLESKGGPFIHVSGVDLMDGTPIYDIKPYIPYCDCIPDAEKGFTGEAERIPLTVEDPKNCTAVFSEENRGELLEILKNDPRPAYHNDPERIYGIIYCGKDVRFRIDGHTLTVYSVDEKGSR